MKKLLILFFCFILVLFNFFACNSESNSTSSRQDSSSLAPSSVESQGKINSSIEKYKSDIETYDNRIEKQESEINRITEENTAK